MFAQFGRAADRRRKYRFGPGVKIVGRVERCPAGNSEARTTADNLYTTGLSIDFADVGFEIGRRR